MSTFPAAKAKSNFGELLDAAQKEPVTITRKGRVVAILMAKADYEHFQAMEDAIWARKADDAIASGKSLGPEETMKFIREVLKDAGA